MTDRSTIPLGHTIPAHQAFGWCSHCPGHTPAEELAAWQTREAPAPAPADDDRVQRYADATATAAAHLTGLARQRAERAEAALARVRAAARLHRQELLSTAELYAVIDTDRSQP